ncbi:short-chain collagen C4-like [Crassostrea angulata]|uniref:short-chain collagen C4-like n=1 Tax=Magallana angulata TaxID=2784310 RepID=UPI0022B1E0B9|nr:short-chain collagen C4-like [Crassostrea angulata]
MGGILHTCIAVVVLLLAFVLGVAFIFEQKIQDLQNELASLKRKRSETKVELLDNTGSLFTRWGRSDCPTTATLIYKGYTGGSLYTHKGAASNYLCLPENPQWGTRSLNNNFKAFVYGAEYENIFFGENALQQDVPCSVCKTKTGTNSVMIPARTSCYDGWTIQYKGYLGAGYHDHPASTEYICVDENVQFVPGGYENKNGVLIYSVVAKCGSLRCHPYIENKPIACVLCSN